MFQRLSRIRYLSLATGSMVWLATVSFGHVATAEAPDPTDKIVAQWLVIADTVLAKHVDPPTRREMLRTAIQAVYREAKQDTPVRLAAKISRPGTEEELREFLRLTLDAVMLESSLDPDKVRSIGIQGLLSKVAGAAGVFPLEEFRVQQQLRDNRYVGIGIQLAMKDSYPTMHKVFPRGPAWQAGGRDGDQMVSIDGLDAKDMPLVRVVQLLRGQEGKPATVVVRRPGAEETIALNMVRGVVPFDTVEGIRQDEDQNWQYTFDDEPRIAYLKIASMRGSTPAELRRIAGQLHVDGCSALVLDLRGTQSGELRYAVMVANALLGASPIGEILSVNGRQQFDSNADQLFPGWPMAVLIDRSTTAQAEWIAAALQDSGRASLLGLPTAGQAAIMEFIELPHGMGGVRLITGTLFRSGGKPLAVAGQFPFGLTGNQVPLRRDAAGKFVPAPRVQRKGVTPEVTIAAINPVANAMKALQEKLDASESATR